MSKPWPADMKCYINVGDSTIKKLIHVYCTVYQLIHYFFNLLLISFNRRKNLIPADIFFLFLKCSIQIDMEIQMTFQNNNGHLIKNPNKCDMLKSPCHFQNAISMISSAFSSSL